MATVGRSVGLTEAGYLSRLDGRDTGLSKLSTSELLQIWIPYRLEASNASTIASTADSDLPTGSQDWPASTPCIKKLEDAYRKDRKAQGFDDSISMDQDNDFASTCKTVGQ